ncbi:hypothetical protein IM700_010080 [Paenibacillus sp. DXFW5]|uniref:Apea-like HEPN domain-containing protein n=1 Tax=Paenibacillus rhizolycopersici TaxID=2780073 RepID=A0ABS2H922_9BACL|nr:hypothetical protein [Paenibacillus rhizolycopersici]MBM6995993.1 hypothetical protein [Paenibacillus rhizolycopersici]
MAKYIEYLCTSTTAFVDKEIVVNFDQGEITAVKTKLSTEGDQPKSGLVRITVYFKETIEFDQAEELGNHKVKQIINSLVFVKGSQINDPYIFKENIKPNSTIVARMQGRFSIQSDFGQEEIDEFVELTKNEKTNHIYYTLYKQSMNHNDNLGKFMFLYSLLIVMIDAKKQKDVDSYIISNHPDEEFNQRQSTRMVKRDGIETRSDELETRFTWLRNQLGHTQQDSEITVVIKEINECWRDLDRIVKNVIKDKVSE